MARDTSNLSKPTEEVGKLYGDVLLGFAEGKVGENVSTEAKEFCLRLHHINEKHPRISRIIKHVIEERYEAATGNDPGSVDWGTVIQWLVDSLPTILKLLMSLFAIFGV